MYTAHIAEFDRNQTSKFVFKEREGRDLTLAMIVLVCHSISLIREYTHRLLFSLAVELNFVVMKFSV